MKKPIFLASACMMMLCSSCIEELNDRSDGLVSVSGSGYMIISAYDLGSKNEIELSVEKAGLKMSEATVSFVVDPSLLDSINAADGKSYQLLPVECYSLENPIFSLNADGNRRVVGGKIVYDPHQIYEKCGFNNLQYILPLRVSSKGMPMNPARSSVIYGFSVQMAIVNFTTNNNNIAVTEKMSPITLTTEVSFENMWNISASFISKGAEYVNDYNNQNNTLYELLPDQMYSIKPSMITKGKMVGTTEVELKKELPVGNYLLPVSLGSISGQEGANISYDKDYVAALGILKGDLINRAQWTIASNTEEMTGEGANGGQAIHLIDGNIKTYWHSRWSGGEVAPPYKIVIDMKKENTITRLGLVARQDALSKMNIQFSLSNDGTTWTPVKDYYFDGSVKTEQNILLMSTKARYIQMYVPSLVNSNVGHMAELYAYGSEAN